MRRRLQIPGIVLGVTLLLGAALFSPLVRALAGQKASDRGFELDIASVRLGWGSLWLLDVDVRALDWSGLTVHLNAIEIVPFGDRTVRARGGSVNIEGSLADLKIHLKDKRPAAGGTGGGSGTSLFAEGINLRISDRSLGTATQHVWGARYRREGQREELGADLVRVGARGSFLELRGPSAALERVNGVRRLLAVETEAVSGTVDLASVMGRADADKDPEPGKPDPPKTELVATAAADASEGASAEHAPWELNRDRPKRLTAGLKVLGDLLRVSLSPGGKVRLGGVQLVLVYGADSLNLGPATLTASRQDGEVELSLVPEGAGASHVELDLKIPLDTGGGSLHLAGGPVRLSQLGVREGDMGLMAVRDTRVRVEARMSLDSEGSQLEFDGEVEIKQLGLQHPKLAAGAVGGIDLHGSGHGVFRIDGSELLLEDVRLRVGDVALKLSLSVEQDEAHQGRNFHLEIPLASCQAMIDSAPRGLLPQLENARATGTFSLDTRVTYDSRKMDDMVAHFELRNECRFEQIDEEYHPLRVRQARMQNPRAEEGLDIVPGEISANWTRLYDISRHMETAVLVCEDSNFWTHQGFDSRAIESSIRSNVKSRRFIRGASTISMQLAKNLYLKRDKTLSRKLQEAYFTSLLEQELSKDQILELYLNVIEYGPGIYGIASAAQFYFRSAPRDLSLGQSLYLASILPNPKYQHFDTEGLVSEKWTGYLRRLMRTAHRIDRITDSELNEAMQEQVALGVPYRAPGALAVESNDSVSRSQGGSALPPGFRPPDDH